MIVHLIYISILKTRKKIYLEWHWLLENWLIPRGNAWKLEVFQVVLGKQSQEKSVTKVSSNPGVAKAMTSTGTT
jgi:hypothetical protein